MAQEFTRLADVPVVKEVKEEASVLIVQDGEVKRAPKTEVGGANTEWDLVVNVRYSDPDRTFVESGNFQNVYNKIINLGEEPKVLVKFYSQNYGERYGITSTSFVTIEKSNPYLSIMFYDGYSDYYISINPDNSIDL